MAETKKKQDFIDKLMEMTQTEINEYIKKFGKPPKLVEMCKIVEKKK